MRLALIAVMVITVGGCGDSPDTKAKRFAAGISIKAVERNIPAGKNLTFQELKIIPDRYGAVCGKFSQEGSKAERFWVGGTDQDSIVSNASFDAGTPILERWEESKVENDKVFSSYCKGMVAIPANLYNSAGIGKQTEADRKNSLS
ncbi:hypothetical protein [Sphingomonas hankookensis]|uniref:hypothetical protein n=1 Tax=Sphingomonas hankookensis TaxID=563996 RepID=UPI003D301F78